jgi:hypothetical protein
MLKTEFEYTLECPYEKGNGKTGQVDEVKTIVLSAPFNRHRAHTSKIKKVMYSAIEYGQNKAAENRAEPDNDSDSDAGAGIDGHMIVGLMMMGGCDISGCLDAFEKLCLAGVAKSNGTDIMTSADFHNISDSDFENMLAEYISNFLLQLMKRMMKSG